MSNIIVSYMILNGGEKQMEKFYCREEELRKLNARYENEEFECLIIYGRRRVGKTALINKFCADKPTIFFCYTKTVKEYA